MKEANTINFENQVFYVGLDVHKRSWTVTIRLDGMRLKTFSMNPNPKELAKYLKRNYPGGTYKTAYEAGFCGFWIHRELIENGIDNIIIHAADVPTTNKEKVNKTDKVDSRKLAKELENNNLTPIYIPMNWELQLRSLCRLRNRLVSHSTRLKNRIKGHLNFYGVKFPERNEMAHWSANFIKYIESMCKGRKPGAEYLRITLDELKDERKRILKVTRSLRSYIKRTPAWNKIIRNLLSIPGVGFLTAVTLYTEIIDINRFKNLARLASFVGVIPSLHASGEHETSQGITPRKNPHLRHLIIEAAWISVRSDPGMLQDFTKLTKRMKKSAAIVRIAKKLLNRIRFAWKNETPYQCFVSQDSEI